MLKHTALCKYSIYAVFTVATAHVVRNLPSSIARFAKQLIIISASTYYNVTDRKH